MSEIGHGRGHVHVIDDDPGQRQALAALLTEAGFAPTTFGNAEAFLEALEHPRTMPPCCVITELRLPGLDGIGLLRALAAAGTALPVILVTGYATVPIAVEAMQLGAADVLEKPVPAERLLGAIHRALAVAAGAGRVAPRAEAEARVAALSNRERQVLGLLVAGASNKTIAHALGLSVRTVEGYRATMMGKLAADSLAAALKLAIAAGLNSPGLTKTIDGCIQ